MSGRRARVEALASGVLPVAAMALLLGAGLRAPALAQRIAGGGGGDGGRAPHGPSGVPSAYIQDSGTGNSGTGAVEGVVTLAGDTVPEPTTVVNATDPEVCGREHSLRDLVVSRKSRGVRHVIASLAGVAGGDVPERPPGRLVIDNRECQFEPHVAVATVGDTIVARNSDPALHTTHYYGPLRSNVALPAKGMTAARVARRPGLVTVLCDVHGWMKAYVRIDPHPFHAVTDSGGRFRIEGVPPGRYTLQIWHEKFGTREVEVEVRAGRVSRLDVEYPAP